jgi:hypothetical protein
MRLLAHDIRQLEEHEPPPDFVAVAVTGFGYLRAEELRSALPVMY